MSLHDEAFISKCFHPKSPMVCRGHREARVELKSSGLLRRNELVTDLGSPLELA